MASKKHNESTSTSISSSVFPFKEYNEYQISDGTAGNAQEAADAVFVKPFESVKLADLSKTDFENLKKMAQAAVDNEQLFNKALSEHKKDSELSQALQRGKIANKVLKLTGSIQVLKVETAYGKTGSNIPERLQEHNKKLKKNVATDAGKASKGKKMISYLSVDGSSKDEHSSSHKSSSHKASSHKASSHKASSHKSSHKSSSHESSSHNKSDQDESDHNNSDHNDSSDQSSNGATTEST